jgi:hypothetical protein
MESDEEMEKGKGNFLLIKKPSKKVLICNDYRHYFQVTFNLAK